MGRLSGRQKERHVPNWTDKQVGRSIYRQVIGVTDFLPLLVEKKRDPVLRSQDLSSCLYMSFSLHQADTDPIVNIFRAFEIVSYFSTSWLICFWLTVLQLFLSHLLVCLSVCVLPSAR